MVIREFVMLCRELALFTDAFVVVHGSKLRAFNNRDRNFTKVKLKRRLRQTLKALMTPIRSFSHGLSLKSGLTGLCFMRLRFLVLRTSCRSSCCTASPAVSTCEKGSSYWHWIPEQCALKYQITDKMSES